MTKTEEYLKQIVEQLQQLNQNLAPKSQSKNPKPEFGIQIGSTGEIKTDL